jgi:hypothetical protein
MRGLYVRVNECNGDVRQSLRRVFPSPELSTG